MTFTGLASCGSGEKAAGTVSYFSLQAFFQNEFTRLARDSIALEKEAWLNDHFDHSFNPSPDWPKELNLFIESDINKPAYLGSYTCDTIDWGDSLAIQYRALEKSLRTRELEIRLRGDSLTGIFIAYEDNNPVFTASRTMRYRPGKGYSISGMQGTAAGGHTRLEIKGQFK